EESVVKVVQVNPAVTAIDGHLDLITHHRVTLGIVEPRPQLLSDQGRDDDIPLEQCLPHYIVDWGCKEIGVGEKKGVRAWNQIKSRRQTLGGPSLLDGEDPPKPGCRQTMLVTRRRGDRHGLNARRATLGYVLSCVLAWSARHPPVVNDPFVVHRQSRGKT